MSIGSALVGATTIILCALPFVLSAISKHKKALLFMQSLAEYAKQHACEIIDQEFCGEFIIGLDTHKNHLFFFRDVKGKETRLHINLSTVRSCKVINENRIIESKSGRYKLTDRLILQILSKQKEQPDLLLTFFDVNDETQISNELQCIEKWAKLINERVK